MDTQTDLTDLTDTPDWLRIHGQELTYAIEHNLDSPDPRFPRTKVERELRNHNLTCLFERILDGMCEGNSANMLIHLDHNRFKVGEVMRWILTNPERKRRYDEADAIRAVVRMDRARTLVDDETADPTYKKEVVDFTKWEASKVNREKYGDRTNVDITTVQVDLRQLLDDRASRIKEVSQSPLGLSTPSTAPYPQGETYDAD